MAAQMTHRERILNSIEHKPVDRLPIDYWGTYEATAKIKRHIGVHTDEELWEYFDMDKIIYIGPAFIGPRQDMWDLKYQPTSYAGGSGIYDEVIKHPLENYTTIDEIEKHYIWPTVDMFDYTDIPRQCDRAEGYATEGGYISLLYFYDLLRGTENMLLDLAANEEIAQYILHKLFEFSKEHVKRIWEAADGRIDITQVTDDFGSQTSLLMSPAMIHHYLEDYYKSNIRSAKDYGIKVFHHDDGAMASMIPWLVEMGIDVLNPLQWHLPGWNLNELKSEYRGRLCFHGGIDNQHVLPFGSREEVRKEVRSCIDALFADKTGYILAPCHNVQSITPPENVIEMYLAAKEFGLVVR